MRILVIPDCQIKEGVPTDHLVWAGKAICEYKPDVVVNMGDFADMPSLSTHDKVGSKYFEGLRYKKDIDVVKNAMDKLLSPIKEMQSKQRKNVSSRALSSKSCRRNESDAKSVENCRRTRF